MHIGVTYTIKTKGKNREPFKSEHILKMKKSYSILTVIAALALTACKSGARNEALHNEELDSAVRQSKVFD